MKDTGAVSLIIILINVFVSYKGLSNNLFLERYRFEVDRILVHKEYFRLITSGFLHVSWGHLIFNMISLLAFYGIEVELGIPAFLAIYFSGLVGGNLLSLFVHRNHRDYTAVGASGAVCAVIFASIVVYPGMEIGFLLLPISIPGWIYGIFYVLFSIYGIRSSKDNIGHDAHLGGALIGMLVALIIYPAALLENTGTILLILVPTLAFLILILVKPQVLLIDNLFFKQHPRYYSIDQKYNAEKKSQQDEIDRILDKINKKGMASLNQKEKEKLERYSRRNRE